MKEGRRSQRGVSARSLHNHSAISAARDRGPREVLSGLFALPLGLDRHEKRIRAQGGRVVARREGGGLSSTSFSKLIKPPQPPSRDKTSPPTSERRVAPYASRIHTPSPLVFFRRSSRTTDDKPSLLLPSSFLPPSPPSPSALSGLRSHNRTGTLPSPFAPSESSTTPSHPSLLLLPSFLSTTSPLHSTFLRQHSYLSSLFQNGLPIPFSGIAYV